MRSQISNLLYRVKRATSAIIVLVLVVSFGMSPGKAEGATLTLFSFTLGNSTALAYTNFILAFTTATPMAGDTVTSDDDALIIVRLKQAGGTCPFIANTALVLSEVSMTGLPAGASVNSVAAVAGTTCTITVGINQTTATPAAVNIPAGTALTLTTANTSATGGAFRNPAKVAAAGTADIYQMSVTTQAVGGTDTDTGSSQVAITEVSAGSASVATTLTFTIAGISQSTNVRSSAHNASTLPQITTTATTIPWGTLVPNLPSFGGQKLTITTNAPSGYLVYIIQDQNLISATTSNDIDQFRDGTRIDDGASNELWTSPAVTVSNEATYGHLGYGSSDAQVFAATEFAGIPTPATTNAVTTTGLVCDGTTAVTNAVCDVEFKIEISALQEAGSSGTAYAHNIQYILVPKY